ncbi:MAG TPA: hypothetical protein PLP23_01020 [Panacibacter sp.]|nr:hypothetical protein [Panacibacter sp.]
MRLSLTIASIILFYSVSFSQGIDIAAQAHQKEVLQSIEAISSKSLKSINDKYSKLTGTVEKQTENLLKRMQQREAKLQKKLQGIDSTKAKELFSENQNKYQELQTKLKSSVDKTIANPLTEYIPGIDSIKTLMKYLSGPIPPLSDLTPTLSKGEGVIQGGVLQKLQQIQAVSSQLQELQLRLQQANNIQNFIKERESTLKSALTNTGLAKELLGYNKEVVYYQQRLLEYKAMLHDKKKLEEKLLASVRNLPAFQNFMQKHSYLAQLFRLPDNYGTPQALAGLQTRASIQQQLQERLGSLSASEGGMNPQQYMQQQIGAAQQQMNVLKDKISKLGGGSSDMAMPDFKPNSQHTKPFLQRLEYGFNVQSEKSRFLLPSTSDLALTLGYKLNDKSVIGIGAAYKLGWGNGLNHIHFTNEGIGMRSYADIKLKGSIWISGGFEYNYLQRFNDFSYLKNIDVWQRSALMGLSKKYKVGKKEGKMQLLYDFLAAKQVPQGQALKFRVGWNF